MHRIRFHQVAALVVLLGAALWVFTGEFSSAGDERDASAPPADAAQQPAAAEPQRLLTVSVATPVIEPYVRRIRVPGRTEPDKRVVLVAQTSGAIRSVRVRDGQRVARDDVILSLEGLQNYAALRTAQALLKQREAEMHAAETLLARGNAAQITVDAAQAAHAAAEEAVRVARRDADLLDVRAPFDGVVDDVLVEQGSWLQPGSEVARLLALNPIRVRGEVSERELAHIRQGTRAAVRLADGSRVDGRVRYIHREASAATRTYPFEVEVRNLDLAIPAGMTAEIELFAEPVEAAVLPRSVVTLAPDGSLGVRAVGAGGRVAFLPVEVIDDTPEGMVLAGIPDGASVIVSGQDLVADGDVVEAVAATALPTGAALR